MTDNLPSGSKWYRLSHCYASESMAEKAEEQGALPPEDTEWTLRGTRIHEGKPVTLDEKEALECTEARLLEAFRTEYPELNNDDVVREQRFYLRDGLVPYFTGQPDRWTFVASTHTPRILIGELKPGFEEDWESWEYQVQSYAALLYEAYWEKIYKVVAYVQTRFYGNRRYEWTADQLKVVIQDIYASTNDIKIRGKTAPTVAGPWCRYCRARLICQSALSYRPGIVFDVPVADLPAGKDGAVVIDKLKLIIKIANDRLKWYTERLKDNPEFVPGWKLATKKTPEITDAREAFSNMSGEIPMIDLWSAISVSLPKIRESVAISRDVSLVKAKVIVDNILGDLLQYKESEPFLVKAKEVKELPE